MNWIKDIVEGLIETCETRDVYEIIDILSIKLIKKKFSDGEKGKFFRNILGDEFIYVADDLTPHEERLVIAHELGHAIIHTNLNVNFYTYNSLWVKDKFEVQANKFAAELLINEKDLDKPKLHDMSINQLSCSLGIPVELIEYKFNMCK